MFIKRTDQEIEDLRNAILPAMDSGQSKYGGMSYEQGIDETLAWLFGEQDDHPYNDE